MNMKRIYTIILLLVGWIGLHAQSESVKILLNDPVTRNANISVCIQDLKTGKVIDAYRPNSLVTPASTIKTLTTATALEMFGGDYRIPTFIEYSGTISNGVLYGNIYIRGNGDPMLGNLKDGQAFLNLWVRRIHDAGIRDIRGKVVADMSYFDGDALNPGWVWEDAGNYYAPCVFALSYMDNTMNIVLHSGAVGSVATVLHTYPEVPEVIFENHIRCTTIDYDGAYVHGVPYNNVRYLTGSIPSNLGQFGVCGDMPNPGLLLAQHLTKHLRYAGITVAEEAGYITEADKVMRTLIYRHESQPLREIVKRTNLYSVNLYAETLYRLFASKISVPCTLHNAENVLRNFWRNRAVDIRSAIIKDGCGLSPVDAISAQSLVQLMTYMYNSTEKDAFYASLPVSATSGTLSGFLVGTELAGRVHAKSGTIDGTKNYAGYIELPDGNRWVFAVLDNNAQGKSKQIKRVIERYLLDVYRRNK